MQEKVKIHSKASSGEQNRYIVFLWGRLLIFIGFVNGLNTRQRNVIRGYFRHGLVSLPKYDDIGAQIWAETKDVRKFFLKLRRRHKDWCLSHRKKKTHKMAPRPGPGKSTFSRGGVLTQKKS